MSFTRVDSEFVWKLTEKCRLIIFISSDKNFFLQYDTCLSLLIAY